MLALCLSLIAAAPPAYFEAPAGDMFAQVVPGGTTVLPNGRFLTPKGKRLYTGQTLWHATMSPDAQTLVALHTDDSAPGNRKPGFTVFWNLSLKTPNRKLVTMDTNAPAAVFSPDGQKFVVSTGDPGGLKVYSTRTWTEEGSLALRENGLAAGYLNDFAFSPDGKKLYSVDVATQKLVTIDFATLKVTNVAAAGRQPYALAISPDGKRIHVANIGIFDYTAVPAATASSPNKRGLTVPPFGFPSKEATDGVKLEGREIAGLGSPFVPDAQSVWTYAVGGDGLPKFEKSAKSGILIQGVADAGKAVGSSAPNALLIDRGLLYVANANNDTISVFDEKTLKLRRTIKLRPLAQASKLRGVIPSGMTMNRAGTRLYVCESGLNSVAVIDPKNGNTLGRIPTGWFPTKVLLTADEQQLAIATQKGIGRGPQGSKHARPSSDERFNYVAMPGMVDLTPTPTDEQLKKLNQEVLRNNGLVVRKPRTQQSVMPLIPGKASDKIKYVVFITKENHTFDGIFGGLKGSRSEADYAEFGMNGWISEKGKAERLPIMQNHVRLAEQFSISDNFYMEPQASGDGHRWLVGVYPSLWTTRVFYAGWDFAANNNARGRMVSFGSNGSQIPEDYLENGSLWEHLDRHGITFRNYGEGYELPGTDEPGEFTGRTGTLYSVNHPMPKVLFDNTDFNFPAYNTAIPDIARADWFKEDLEKYRKANGGKFPQFINAAICNDHGDSPKPNRGYPYVASYMADNDLALGRMVEYLSHQPEWKNMAIFVTQDDSGGDADSVDRHRSFVLAISPYAKRGYVSHDHSSIISIIKSIYLLFGIGPNNMFDGVATPLHDMFTDKPDFTPYTHVPVDPRVFKPEATFDPQDPDFKRRRSERPTKMDDPKFIEWLRTRGGDKD